MTSESKKKTLKKECSACGCSWALTYCRCQSSPLFCPFCGEELVEELNSCMTADADEEDAWEDDASDWDTEEE